jgi:outer membrane autotransporter protein
MEQGISSLAKKLNDANTCNNGDNYLSFMEYVDNEYKNGNLDEKLTNDLAYAVAKNDPNVMNNMLAVQNTSKIKGMQGIVKSFNDIIFNRNARYLNYNQEYEDSYYYGYETENNMSFWYGFNYVNKSNRYECGTNEQKTTAYTNMIGFDYAVELENQGMMIYGASLGYSFGNSSGGEFNDISTGVTQDEMNMDMSVVNFALYTGYVFGNNSLFFDVNGMFFNDKLIRTINVPNIYNIAESKSNDFVLSVNLQDTYKIELEDSMFNFEPYTRLMYNLYALDGYTEEGTNSAFVVKGENYNELLFSMGSYMNFNLEEYDYENVKPYLNFNLNYNLLNDKVVTNADFFYNNNINSSGFNVKDAEMRKLNMETGIGMIYVISETSHFNFEYSFSYDFDKSFNNQVFIKYSYKF